ncbi:glycosyltransferase [Flavobacterium psychrotrophum]|uniref:glycosyltransferase n=1 Tax=Flavobacterium psychrotrophum TaxID=2294119 RepID=UPI000E312D6C|nr:glycosyltransferase [Flavobacterium psychrotrophum]
MKGQPTKITALAIVYNEEHNIREYLENISFADEIVVVDSYSTDATPEIIKAEYPHVRFYQRAFDDFSSQRNYTIELASHDWVMFFDADERITQKGVEEIIAVIKSDPEEAAFWVKRIFYYQGRPLVNNNFNEDRTARIFRKSKCRYSDKLVHEQLTINGKSRVLKYAIEHYSFKDKEDFLQKRLQYSRLKAKEFYQEGVRTNILHFTVRPAFRFFKYYVLKLGFINGKRGYDVARILGYHVYMRYVYLRELNNAAQKILVIQQKMIGDVLASSVICNTLRETYPEAQIDYMVYDFTRPVVQNNPNIDHLVIFTDAQRKSRIALLKFALAIRKSHYNVVIDAYSKWESGIISLISGAKTTIGFRKWYTSFFYDKTVEPDWRISNSALVHRMQLAEAYTGTDLPAEFPKIYLEQQEIEAAQKLLSEKINTNLPVIMLSVMGSDDIKSLPAEEMAKIADFVAENSNAQLLFNYLPKQADKAKEIFNFCKPQTQQRILLDLYLGDLRQMIAVLSQCTALIGNEGGAVNMAKALNIPTFTLFSPWINKGSWDMLTETNKHTAVHLQDFYPEIYAGKHPKEFKEEALELYKKLQLDLFKDKLALFIEENIVVPSTYIE